MGALFKMSAKMTRFSNWEKLAVLLQRLVLCSMVIYAQCTVQEQQQKKTKKKTFNFLKRALTTSGAAILFCLVAMQRSVADSEAVPNTVTLFGNVPLHSEALRSAL